MDIPVRNNQLPSGFCPANYQEMLNGFTNEQYVQLDTAGARIAVSTTAPDTSMVWLRLSSDGTPLRAYIFTNGAWLSLHPTVPGLTMWWFDAMDDTTIKTFDGGADEALSAITGPMWRFAKDASNTVIAAKFPIVAGTTPAPYNTVLNVGDTGGEEKVTLTIAEMPEHSHPHNLNTNQELRGNDPGSVVVPNPVSPITVSGQEVPQNTEIGGGEAHNNMPLYVVGYLLQRTSRLFYTVT